MLRTTCRCNAWVAWKNVRVALQGGHRDKQATKTFCGGQIFMSLTDTDRNLLLRPARTQRFAGELSR